MVQRAKENAALSGLSDAPIRYIVDDCFKFCEREKRRGNTYDAIIMDPPSYGRGPNGEKWTLEDNIDSFVALASTLLSDDPLFFLLNSYTTGLQSGVLTYMLESALKGHAPAKVESGEVGLPVSGNGLVLPCGCAGRAWWD
jgi:23S rRNA (cytosine1962-C5)-methyltransferase